MSASPTPHLLLRLFLPFAAGYFLSYLFRTVNAVMGPVIAGELALPDNALGLLTSAYFLAFGLAQLPLGMLLDRYGPRRVEAGLLLIAALGTALFALADGLTALTLGRALIGLGVSACLMASLKAFTQWFPLERQASMTGWIMAAGGLGALAAAKPLEIALGFTGWRDILLGLAVITVLVALAIWRFVPDQGLRQAQPEQFGINPGFPGGLAEQLAGVRTIFVSRHFWRYAPMGFCFTGGFMAIQGLWASRWMNVMENLDAAAVAARLTWMGSAMLGGFLFMGFFATALVHRGISLEKLFRTAMFAAFVAFSLISLQPQWAGDWLWPLLGACFSLSNIAYTLVAQAFPTHLSGRANTALNLLVFAGAFGLQWGIGILVDSLQAAGWPVAGAYSAAFQGLLGAQLLSLIWFLSSRRHV